MPYGFLIYARLSCFTRSLYFESEEAEESEPVSVEDYESLLILKKVLSEENKGEGGNRQDKRKGERGGGKKEERRRGRKTRTKEDAGSRKN